MRLVIVNPYSAGSHAQWAQGMARELPLAAARFGAVLEVELQALPGRHWKWRMHAAALTLVDRMQADGVLDRAVDAFLVTDMLDAAQFRAALPPSHRAVPVIVYFHENQLTFPAHPERPPAVWDRHYAFVNVSSALVADAVWFNSAYHRDLFLSALPDFMAAFPAPRPVDSVLRIGDKAEVVPIGIGADALAAGVDKRPGTFGPGAPVVVWNHRWEHDKGPGAFLACLDGALEAGFEFRLAVLGQSFDQVPPAFDALRQRYADRLVAWGYEASRSEYIEALRSSDVALVTAHHDFFGISVLEAAASGAHVVAPNELAYPEHFGAVGLHHRRDLQAAFLKALARPEGNAVKIAEKYAWPVVADRAWSALNRVQDGFGFVKAANEGV